VNEYSFSRDAMLRNMADRCQLLGGKYYLHHLSLFFRNFKILQTIYLCFCMLSVRIIHNFNG
jgi:hypothetical protein